VRGEEISADGDEWVQCPGCKEKWAAAPQTINFATARQPRRRKTAIGSVGGGASGGSPKQPWAVDAEAEAGEEEGEDEMWALEGLDVQDLFRREGKDGRHAAERAHEMLAVAKLLKKHHKAIKGVHTYYANMGKLTDEEDIAGAFTIDKGELKKFIDDCGLLCDKLTRAQLDLIFIRGNWDGPAGESRSVARHQGGIGLDAGARAGRVHLSAAARGQGQGADAFFGLGGPSGGI